MAIPTVVGAGTLASGTGNVSPGLPSGWAVDDIHCMLVATANEGVTAPSGWTEDANSPQGTGTAGGTAAIGLAVFWRRAEAGDTAPTITDPGNHCAARILGIRGCPASGSPIDVSSGDVEAVASENCTFSGVTTSVADTLLLHACARATQASGAYTFTPSNGSLANFSEQFKNAWSDGNGGTFSVWTATKATAGATGDSTGTWFRPFFDMSDVQALMLIAFRGALTVSASLTASAAVTASLTTAIRCAATLTGSAAVTASLTTAIRCAATLTGSAAVTASLTTAIQCAATLTGSAAVTAGLTTAIRCAATLTGSASIVASLATSYGIVDVVLDDTILTATAFDQTGQVQVLLDSTTLVAGGYFQPRSGTLSVTLDDATVAAAGIPLATRVGSLEVTLDSVTLDAAGDARTVGGGSVVILLDSTGVVAYGLKVPASTGSVSVTLDETTLETLAGHGAVGAVLSIAGGRLDDTTLAAVGKIGNEGQLAVTLEDARLSANGERVVMQAAYARNGVHPGILAYGGGGLTWSAPASEWQSLCANGLIAANDNPSGMSAICVTPVSVP